MNSLKDGIIAYLMLSIKYKGYIFYIIEALIVVY